MSGRRKFLMIAVAIVMVVSTGYQSVEAVRRRAPRAKTSWSLTIKNKIDGGLRVVLEYNLYKAATGELMIRGIRRGGEEYGLDPGQDKPYAFVGQYYDETRKDEWVKVIIGRVDDKTHRWYVFWERTYRGNELQERHEHVVK